jgi:hypothetical protein
MSHLCVQGLSVSVILWRLSITTALKRYSGAREAKET